MSGLDRLNRMDADEARAALLTVCSSPAWAWAVVAGRPYPEPEALYAEAERALAGLGEAEVDAALAGHPRIGERPEGSAGEASRREQAGLSGAGADVLRELAEGNRAYEERFGHVYLVCATGRGAEELLGVLRARLGNDPVTERAVLRRELGRINRLRLERMVAQP